MSANTSLRVSELDFDTIRANLKDYLRSQSEFQDFDFEGSGMSVLLDLLAYNTHYMGYYLNVVGNEMFIDSAQLRNSVISHAKHLNYVPKSRIGAKAKVNITVTRGDGVDANSLPTSIVLNKYSPFLGADISGKNYQFVAQDSNIAFKAANNTYYFANVALTQGEVVTRQFLVDNNTNPKRRYKLTTPNLDADTLVVTVQESSTNTDISYYSQSEDITLVTNESKVYFIEEDADGSYALQFGDGVIGYLLKDGNIIIATYVDTSGLAANNIGAFKYVGDSTTDFGFSSRMSVTAVGKSYGSAEKESIEQVRYRAPYHYTSQNRAVTKLDYENLILKDYPFIEAASIWGGQDNDPPVYGKVFICLKPKSNYFLTNLEIENIKNTLIQNRNVLTIIPEIVDPEYTYLLIRGSVYYNESLTSLSPEQIKQYVHAAISDYRIGNLLKFNSVFRKSKLQALIEASDPSITGSDIKIFLQKRLTLDLTQTKNYTIETNFGIKKGDFNNRISTYPQINVKDSGNITRQVFFEEVPESFTGIDSISIVNAGINYTSQPTVTINGDGSGATAIATYGGGRIKGITVTNKGSNYTRATVSITGGGGSQAVAVAKLASKIGTLRTFYYKSNGEKVIVNANAGTVNYETGEIVLNALETTGTVSNTYYDTNVLVFNLPIDTEIIEPLRNRILEIDESDALSIQVEVLAES